MPSPKARIQRMSPAVFDATADTLRLSHENRSLARRVLVDGMTGYAVSRETQKKPQVIYAAIRRVREAHARATSGQPTGWISVTVSIPVELAGEVLAIERRAHEGQPLPVAAAS